MADFTFTSTSECDFCGAYLSSSDEDCDHDGNPVETHVFRRMNSGRESLIGVECAIQYKWYALEEKVGDDWIAYQWLGTREFVESMVNSVMWDNVEELPMKAMSLDAPKDISE